MDIVKRFISHTKISTTTSRKSGTNRIMPSSPGQIELAKLLAMELGALGMEDIEVRDTVIVTAALSRNTDDTIPIVSFFGHLDTSIEQTADTGAQHLHYSDGDLHLDQGLNTYPRESELPELKNYVDDDLLMTDGTSLLGADDKTAIATIMNALEHLVAHPKIKHGPVGVSFAPDEEQGLRGAKTFDVAAFGTDSSYTLDCCGIGELVYENWNAGNTEIIPTGQSAHPMSTKSKLENSLLVAHKFIVMLPSGEAPEYTEGREGYCWIEQLQGNNARTVFKLDIRDFTEGGYKARMAYIRQLAVSTCALWGESNMVCHLTDRYANMFNSLQGDTHYPIDITLRAYQRCGITPQSVAMRGGYDGAVLSQKGLPCPNIFTGAHSFRSIYKYLPVRSLRTANDVVIAAIKETLTELAQKRAQS